MDRVDILTEIARKVLTSRHLVIFTGAGMSADSGIPTFRGDDGIWKKFRPEDLATSEAFNRDPVFVWKWYLWRISKVRNVKPHKGYRVLKKWYDHGILKKVITQNVDGLFRRVGIDDVIELHGNIEYARCVRCGYRTLIYSLDTSSLPILCPRCYSYMRPDVVWFGESLDESIVKNAFESAVNADVFIVIGTSGVVYPAAYIPYLAKKNGAYIIEINVEESAITDIADVFVNMRASEALDKIDKMIKKIRG